MKQTVSAQCDQFDDKMIELKKQLKELREQWSKIDMEALDAEEHEFWHSGMVEEFLMNIQTAEEALDGLM